MVNSRAGLKEKKEIIDSIFIDEVCTIWSTRMKLMNCWRIKHSKLINCDWRMLEWFKVMFSISFTRSVVWSFITIQVILSNIRIDLRIILPKSDLKNSGNWSALLLKKFVWQQKFCLVFCKAISFFFWAEL